MADPTAGAGKTITNRSTATPPGGGRQDPAAEGDDDQARAKKITNRANELQGQNPKRMWGDCYQQATREAYQAAE
jgi:hypothetical protein